MYLVRFIRWLLGTVRFTLRGIFSERFINLVYKNGLRLWGTQKREDGFDCYTVAGDYKRMHRLARATGVRIRVQEKRGAPFWLHRYRKRVGVVLGILLFCLFLGWMSRLCWTIEVVGNEAVSSEQIVQAVAESGIKRGANIKKIDLKSAEERTMVLLPGLSSISISNMGTTVVVEVKEVREKLPVVDASQPCNLVAAKKGRITRVLALEGNAAVKVGEYVTEGQLLVTGVYEDRWGKALFKHSQGQVFAETEEEITFEIPLTELVKTPVGKVKNRHVLEILGFKVPLFFPGKLEGDYLSEVERQELSLFGLTLPITWHTQHITPVEVGSRELGEEEALGQAQARAQEYADSHYQGKEVQIRQTGGEMGDGAFRATFTLTCEQDIAQEQAVQR